MFSVILETAPRIALFAICLLTLTKWYPARDIIEDVGIIRDVAQLRVDLSYVLALPQLYLDGAQFG